MKNLIKLSILVFLLSLGAESFAQTFGIKAGVNFSNMLVKGDDFANSDDFEMKAGYHFGPMVELPISKIFSFESGLLLSIKGFKRPVTTTYKSTLNLLYLDLPLNIRASIGIGGAKIYAVFGPYIGIGLIGEVKSEVTNMGEKKTHKEDIRWGANVREDHFKRLDFGLAMGVGVEISSFQIGLNYGLGLANISAVTTRGIKIKNRVFGISLGYIFEEK